MYAQEQIKEFLKLSGRLASINLSKEIKLIAEYIGDNRVIEFAGIGVRGSFALKQHLIVLTSDRIITSDSKKNIIEYCINEIENGFVNRKKLASNEVSFTYNGENITINTLKDDSGQILLGRLISALGIIEDDTQDERQVVKAAKAISFTIDIINGKEQLAHNENTFRLIQSKAGEVSLAAGSTKTPENFKLIKWERVENIQKSALDIAGWTVIGSALGNAGALAGAMGANIGKDKSVATLYLKRENDEKVALVIKCGQRDLEKLSMLIVAEEEPVQQLPTHTTITGTVPTEELIKLKELLDAGILTQEEFDMKKKQLLGI